MDLGLRKKNVLITGSTNGLGKAIAKIMAEEGANVIISGRNEIAAKQLAEEIERTNQVQAIPIIADLSQQNAAEQYRRLTNGFGIKKEKCFDYRKYKRTG